MHLINQLGLDNDALAKFRSCTNTDETSQVVMEYGLTGWPADKAQVDELAQEYFSFREELSVEDGLMGEAKSLSYARDYVFWPGMKAQVKDRVRSCGICNAFRNQQQKETLKLHDVPGLPWQTVGHTYVVVTDFYSKFFELELLCRNTATCLINNVKKVFARYGIPEEVISDNGSQYSNTRNLFHSTHEFKMFAKEWGFKHTTSSPEYPQSNGAAERAVQTAKRILKKASADGKDPFGGLLEYRNTPFKDIGLSPAQLLMSRRTRTMLPQTQAIANSPIC